jgi:peptidoglycan/xylan/chitin deacetylase (PgdA/CDA1 family)
MYHSVSRLMPDPNMVCVSPGRFEEQMRYLKRRGLQGVSVGELLRRVKGGNAANLVGLTFDDGYKDFLTDAIPVMEKFGFRGTVFAVAGKVENDWEHAYRPRPQMELLSADQLRAVRERGMEVGAHSVTHPRLAELGPDLLEQEVGGSRRILGELLGEEVQGFCYPYGSLDAAALASVRKAGYRYACAWNVRIAESDYDLPRIPVSERDTLIRFVTKLRVYAQYSQAKVALSRLRAR